MENVSFNSVARKEDLNKGNNKYKLTKMEQKIISVIGIFIIIIIGWDKISVFINSLFEGFTERLKSIPPLILLGIGIFIFWALGHKE